MPPKDSVDPGAWFARCDNDLAAARILMSNDGPVAVVGFLVQQALEKSLKGFLVARGAALRRTHDLELLLNDAIERAPALEEWRSLCEAVNPLYVLDRYPIRDVSPLDEEEAANLLDRTEQLVDHLRTLAS